MKYAVIRKLILLLKNYEQDLTVKLSAMDDMLRMLSSQTDQVASRTSAVGREALKRDLRRVSDENEMLTTQLSNLMEQLQFTMSKWNEFETLYSNLIQWLESLGQDIRALSESTVDLETKLGKVSHVKVSNHASLFTSSYMSSFYCSFLLF